MEVLVRLQLGITLSNHHEFAESLRELSLRGLELLEFLRRKVAGIEFHLPDGGPCLSDLLKGLALVLGVSLYRLGEIRDEIGTPLIRSLHVSQRRRSRLLLLDHSIIGTATTNTKQYYHRKDDEYDQISFLHIERIKL